MQSLGQRPEAYIQPESSRAATVFLFPFGKMCIAISSIVATVILVTSACTTDGQHGLTATSNTGLTRVNLDNVDRNPEHLPLMPYLIAGQDLVTVTQVEGSAMRACLDAHNLPTLPDETDFEEVVDTSYVGILGYDLTEPPSSWGEIPHRSGVLQVTVDYLTNGKEATPDQLQTQEDCLQGTENPVAGSRSFIPQFGEYDGLAKRLWTQSLQDAMSDPRSQVALGEWRTCLTTKGYELPTPKNPTDVNPPEIGPEASPEEADAVMNDDAGCSSQSKLVDTRFAVATELQQGLIQKHQADLESGRIERDLIVQRADEFLVQQ